LKSGAVIRKFADTVQHKIYDLFAYGVMAAGEIVGSVLLTSDELLWMEQLTVSSGAHLVNHGGFEVNHHTTWDVLAGTSLAEECVERIIATANGLVRRHLSIRLNAMLQAEKLPARISNLDTSLADVEAKGFTHVFEEVEDRVKEGGSRRSDEAASFRAKTCLTMWLA